MFDRPPKEREATSWAYALAWAGLTIATVPYVRGGVSFVSDHLGPGFFTYGVVTLVVLAAGAALYGIRQRLTLASSLWLLGLVGVIIYQTFGLADGSAVEAVHFVQYGTLSLLLFRAFSHRVRDHSIYAASTIVGTLAGMVDETVQWLVPNRVFDLRDIWLNFEAIALTQLGVAAVVRPAIISGWPGWHSLKRLCYLGAVTLGYLGLCLQNTPDRVSWYSANVPALGFIDPARNVMVEYGYLHGDGASVTFRSRLALDKLHQLASRHPEENVANLDDVHRREAQGGFHFRDLFLSNTYLYEARLHQLRRDQNLERAKRNEEDSNPTQYFTAAHWENRILNDYFSEPLLGSRYEWSPEIEVVVREGAKLGKRYESTVSEHLIVAYDRRQLAFLVSAAVTSLLFLAYVSGTYARREHRP